MKNFRVVSRTKYIHLKEHSKHNKICKKHQNSLEQEKQQITVEILPLLDNLLMLEKSVLKTSKFMIIWDRKMLIPLRISCLGKYLINQMLFKKHKTNAMLPFKVMGSSKGNNFKHSINPSKEEIRDSKISLNRCNPKFSSISISIHNNNTLNNSNLSKFKTLAQLEILVIITNITINKNLLKEKVERKQTKQNQVIKSRK